MTTPEIKAIAEGLSKAQRLAITDMAAEWTEWPDHKLNTHKKHMCGWGKKHNGRRPLIEGIYEDPCTRLRLTTLGQAVRAYLMRKNDDQPNQTS